MTSFLGCAFIWATKLYKNNMKMISIVPMLVFFCSSMYTKYKYSSVAFDKIVGPLPVEEIEKERMRIINQCMLGDYVMAMQALKQELAICKPPVDYIYNTLI